MINKLRFQFRGFRVAFYIGALVSMIIWLVTNGMPLLPLFAFGTLGIMLLLLLQEHFANPNYHWTDGIIEVIGFGACGAIVMSGFVQ